jgi:AraC-like DNA-binding protein
LDVAAFLPPVLLAHLRVVLGERHAIYSVEAWDELDFLVRRSSVDIAVVDPGADGLVRTTEIRSLIEQYPTLPMVLYTQLSPLTLKALVELAKYGTQQVVLHRFDDSPAKFRLVLERQPGSTLSSLILERLSEPVGALPGALARAVERMFKRPGQFFGVPDLASAAQMPRRTVYRYFEVVGLASPRMVVTGARMLRAYSYMREPGHSLLDVAKKLGYTQQQLRRSMVELVGQTPVRVRTGVDAEQFVGMLAQHLYPAGPGTGRHARSLAEGERAPDGLPSRGRDRDVQW